MTKLYYEDIEIGHSLRFGSYHVTLEEIISFATKWDPQPFHIDEQAGKESVFGSITACGAHTIAIQSLLLIQNPNPYALLAGLGSEEMNLITPVIPGDVLSTKTIALEKRLSQSKPDRGILTNRMSVINQCDEVVIDQTAKILIACRPAN
jgi:acyl dehydratase